ncbi:MAG: 16S rRNA (uracil(1498)-N(3))-methyltransferase [Treponema sp.]|nr:16S rRNA (uracil(1498)-N(3))-methyltransferase [Treponema sp.]
MNLFLFEAGELYAGEHGAFSGGTLCRRDERAEHLIKVLHKKPRCPFDAGVLGGRLGTGVIEEINAETLRFSLTLNADPPPRLPLRLGVGFPRPIQLRRLLRDCASLGLAAVDLVYTDLGEKSYRDTKLLKSGGARAALIEGAVQARDTRLPELSLYPGLATWLKDRPWEMDGQSPDISGPGGAGRNRAPILLAAADNTEPRGSFADLDRGGYGAAVLAAGSERGWSSRERDLLETAGFLRLSLGSRALRTETACVAAAALLMEKTGSI